VQGIKIMLKFWEDKIYFGDYKPENLLVSFKGMVLVLGDFGCSMQIKEYENYGKGCTPKWCIPEIALKIRKGMRLSLKEL